SDFADIFEVRGLHRDRRGVAETIVLNPETVLLRYEGLDGRTRQTTVGFDPRPTRLDRRVGLYQVNLQPKQCASIFVAVACDQPERTKAVPFFKAMFGARRDLRLAAGQGPPDQELDALFNEMGVARDAARRL